MLLDSGDQSSNSTSLQSIMAPTDSFSMVPPGYDFPPDLGAAAATATSEVFGETQNSGPIPPQYAPSDSGYESRTSNKWCQCESAADLPFAVPQDNYPFSSNFVDPGDLSFFDHPLNPITSFLAESNDPVSENSQGWLFLHSVDRLNLLTRATLQRGL
jgi:hypothetical protein